MSGATVLFDFDGTLVRGDCAAAWLRSRLTDSTWRKLAAGLTWPFLKPGFRWWRCAWLPASFYTWLATVGRTPESLEEAREDFLQDCARRATAGAISSASRRRAQSCRKSSRASSSDSGVRPTVASQV